jgi:hypothetical protein
MFYILYLYDVNKYTQWFEIKYNINSLNIDNIIKDKNFNYKDIEIEWIYTYK